MKLASALIALVLASCHPLPALASLHPFEGTSIASFQYLDSDKAKLVHKPVKIKKVKERIARELRELPASVRIMQQDVGRKAGKASYYWQGQRTANGEVFKPDGISCAHKTLPFNTMLRVTNLLNGKSVVCRVNDRGPFIAGRVVDLSRGAAHVVSMTAQGVVPVSLQVVR